MKLEKDSVQRLRLISGVLLRCFVVTVIAMLFVWGVVFVARKPIQQMHVSMFGLSAHEFDLFLYGFLTLIKCLNVVLFLFPYLAIQHILRGQKNAE
jgi:hypothetical protein